MKYITKKEDKTIKKIESNRLLKSTKYITKKEAARKIVANHLLSLLNVFIKDCTRYIKVESNDVT